MFEGFTAKELEIEKGLLNQAIEDFKYKFNCHQIINFNFFINIQSYAKTEMNIKDIDKLNLSTEMIAKLIKCLTPNGTVNIIDQDTFTFKVKYQGTTNYSLGIAFWRDLVGLVDSWIMIKTSEQLLNLGKA